MRDPSGRLLRLLSFLQTPREWPGAELAERLEVTIRTIRRDVERLRDLGYPVQAVHGRGGGYRLGAGAAMPPLLVDEEEAVAIAVGLRLATTAAVAGIEDSSLRALAKLEQVLPSRLRDRVTAVSAAAVTLPSSTAAAVDAELLAGLASACVAREKVRFAYRPAAGEATRRLTEPYQLAVVNHRWYLVAFDEHRDDWRTFRVDRMGELHRTGVRCAVRELPGGVDAANWVVSWIKSLG